MGDYKYTTLDGEKFVTFDNSKPITVTFPATKTLDGDVILGKTLEIPKDMAIVINPDTQEYRFFPKKSSVTNGSPERNDKE